MQEVFPHQVLCLGLVSCALRVLSPQTGTSGAGAGLGDVLTEDGTDTGGRCMFVPFSFLVYKLLFKVNMLPSVRLYLHSVVFLVVVCILAVSECAVTVHSLDSPAEGAVGGFGVLLAGRFI